MLANEAVEVKVVDLPAEEKALFSDLLAATAKATADGVEPNNVLGVMIAALVNESIALDADLDKVLHAVRLNVMHALGGLS